MTPRADERDAMRDALIDAFLERTASTGFALDETLLSEIRRVRSRSTPTPLRNCEE